MASRIPELGLAAGLVLATVLPACRDDGSGKERSAPTPSAATAPPVAPQGIATGTGPRAKRQPEPRRRPGSVAAAGPDEPDEPDTDVAAHCAPATPTLKPLQLLRFRFASAVEDREPVDQLHVARPGQRVWAHLRVRNRSGRSRCLRLVFRINGAARTELTLEVGESWNWRTWAYATLRDDDRSGTVELEALDDQGNLVARERLPIVPEPS